MRWVCVSRIDKECLMKCTGLICDPPGWQFLNDTIDSTEGTVAVNPPIVSGLKREGFEIGEGVEIL